MFARFVKRSHSSADTLPALLLAIVLANGQVLLLFPNRGANHVHPMAALPIDFKAPEYILPLWPAPSRASAEHVHFLGNAASHAVSGVARPRPPRPQLHTDPAPIPPPQIPQTYQGSRLYIEPEVDRPVVRDPLSDGPAYPEFLRSHHIEGSVVVRFIVDTLGFADSLSFNVIETSHPGFADAVRVALPRMRFLPAEQAGHHVPQLVMQQFRFVLDRPDTGVSRPVARSE